MYLLLEMSKYFLSLHVNFAAKKSSLNKFRRVTDPSVLYSLQSGLICRLRENLEKGLFSWDEFKVPKIKPICICHIIICETWDRDPVWKNENLASLLSLQDSIFSQSLSGRLEKWQENMKPFSTHHN